MIISPETFLLGLQIVLICIGVLAVAYAAEWGINWLDRRDAARRQRPKYSTADAKQVERDGDKLWRGAWRDTMPPAEPAAPRRQHHDTRANVHQLRARPEREARR